MARDRLRDFINQLPSSATLNPPTQTILLDAVIMAA